MLFIFFSFTVAARTGFLYNGTGEIMVGGGDELWLYINGVLVIELTSTASASSIACKTIDISGVEGISQSII